MTNIEKSTSETKKNVGLRKYRHMSHTNPIGSEPQIRHNTAEKRIARDIPHYLGTI